LIEVSRDVADFVEVVRPHLTDVQVDHVAVVGINLVQLGIGKICSVKPVLHMHMLVRESNRWVTVMVARGLLVVNADILGGFVLINLEVEVRLGLDFRVNIAGEAVFLFLSELLFKVECIELLFHEGVDAALDLLEM
jgi:hypothetical protein